MNLIIVESPGKVKKIQSILGPNWKVAASVGHVRDLPVKELGVSLPDFKPEYPVRFLPLPKAVSQHSYESEKLFKTHFFANYIPNSGMIAV